MKIATLLCVSALEWSVSALQAQFVTRGDYPVEALRHHWEGTTDYTVTVYKDGSVGDCRIKSSSGHEVLDKAACEGAIRRYHFSPALDESGNPIESEFSSRVRWQIGHR